MVDAHFADPELAAIYDRLHPGSERDDFAFYRPMVMAAERVLDVGCGTGELLRRAHADGHRGRLCGLDPAPAMLDVARACSGVEWVAGDLASANLRGPFDLVVMTGHAFQVLLTDADIATAFVRVRDLLAPDGRFGFETRNPTAETWRRWTPDHAVDVRGPDGQTLRMAHQVALPVDGELVSFTTTYTSPQWRGPRTSHSTLRFVGCEQLTAFLDGAGLAVAEQYGDWDRSSVTDASPEIVTIARRV